MAQASAEWSYRPGEALKVNITALSAVGIFGGFRRLDTDCLPPHRCPNSPPEIRPHVCTALPADAAGEALLDVGQPQVIGPRIGADPNRVAAAVVGAVNEQSAHPLSRSSAKMIFCGRSGMPESGSADWPHDNLQLERGKCPDNPIKARHHVSPKRFIEGSAV